MFENQISYWIFMPAGAPRRGARVAQAPSKDHDGDPSGVPGDL